MWESIPVLLFALLQPYNGLTGHFQFHHEYQNRIMQNKIEKMWYLFHALPGGSIDDLTYRLVSEQVTIRKRGVNLQKKEKLIEESFRFNILKVCVG